MAIVNVKKKLFEKEIGRLTDDMQNKIALFGTPIESIDDDIIQIEIFPNRPDLLSYQSFKRSFLAFLGKKTGICTYNLKKPEKDYMVTIDASVKDVRPYTACAVVRGLRLDDDKIKELIEIQEKLHMTLGRKRKKVAIGIYPLDKIKLPITFKAVEPDKIKFTPLESDKELSGLEILQKHPAGKEYSHLLAGKAKFPVFIDSNKNILSMPPIINSELTGRVTEKTKDVFVECSGFNLESQKLCLNILTTCMAEMGGKIYQMDVKSGLGKKEITPDLSSEKMKVSIENINKLIGIDLKEKQVKGYLERMGYNYNNNIVEIPAWRVDILHEVDIIEDIAIAYGYDKLVPEIPEISTIGQEGSVEKLKRNISLIFSGIGAIEVSNYHLTNKKDQSEKMSIPEKKSRFIQVENSKTEYNILRGNLTHFILKNLSDNVDSEYPHKIFEVGKVFVQEDNSINEKEMLSCALSPGNFTEIKQTLEYFFRMIDQEIVLKEPQNQELSPDHFIEGRIAEIIYKGKSIGFMGEVKPKILKNWKIRMPVSLFEIELDDVFKDLEKV